MIMIFLDDFQMISFSISIIKFMRFEEVNQCFNILFVKSQNVICGGRFNGTVIGTILGFNRGANHYRDGLPKRQHANVVVEHTTAIKTGEGKRENPFEEILQISDPTTRRTDILHEDIIFSKSETGNQRNAVLQSLPNETKSFPEDESESSRCRVHHLLGASNDHHDSSANTRSSIGRLA